MDPSAQPVPGWYPDPTGRHGQRWWDGRTWSEHVADGQAVASDPLSEAAPTDIGGTAAVSPAEQRAAIEWAVRDADGEALPKGWPSRYEPAVAAVLTALDPAEKVLGAWRMRTVGPRQRATDVGVVVVTDGTVVGADRSPKSEGLFRIPVADVATVELVNRRAGSSDLGWEIHLLGSDGQVLGPPDSPAEFQVFAKGRDPSAWDSHPQGEEDLAAVQRALLRILPGAAPARGEVQVATAGGAPAPPPLAQEPPPEPAPVGEPTGPVPATAIVFTPSARSAQTVGRLVVPTAAVSVGDAVTFTLVPDPWPDPKLEHVEVTLAHRSTTLREVTGQASTAVGLLFTPPGPVMAEGAVSGAGHDVTIVARGTVSASDLAVSGQVDGSIVVPELSPPTIDGIVDWRLSAAFHRRRGIDHDASATLTVGGARTDRLLGRVQAGADETDWLLRACDVPFAGWATRLAPVARARNVEVRLARSAADTAGRVAGRLLVRADDGLVSTMARRYRKEADATGQATIASLRVVLECWRGSATRATCQRMFHLDTEVAGPVVITRDTVVELPFEVRLPPSARLLASYQSPTREQRLPTTFVASGAAAAVLDDIRWRVVGQAIPAGRSPGDATPSSPLWGAAEVVVGDVPGGVPRGRQ